MDHVHFDNPKKTIELGKLLMTLLTLQQMNQLFKLRILNATEIIRDKKKKRPDIETIHDYIMKTEASNAGKTLTENLVKELIKHNILINKKTTQGLDSFKILRNVD